jgi:hypothetical protein
MSITLILENGTGVTNANAYVDVAFVDDYSDTILGCTWKDNVSLQNLAIVNASRFIDMRYSSGMPAKMLTTTQGLLFPRTEFYDKQCNLIPAGTIPLQLKRAVAHAAIMFIEDKDLKLITDEDNNIKQKTVSIGSGAIQESITYFGPSNSNKYVIIDSYMHQILKSNNSGLSSVPSVRG